VLVPAHPSYRGRAQRHLGACGAEQRVLQREALLEAKIRFAALAVATLTVPPAPNAKEPESTPS
jgi:hypothetical protein